MSGQKVTITETEGISKKNYDPKYNIIFSFFYLIQGIVQGFPMILPSYIMHVTGDLNFNAAATLAAAGTLPWATKFLIGVLNDKWGSKKYGRRFPFIFFFGIWGGIWFILGGFNIPTDDTIYDHLFFYFLMINIGMAYADTSIDGMILDITPKDKLAKVQSYTWSCLLIGSSAGAMGLGAIFMFIEEDMGLQVFPIFFIITGILMIISVFAPYLVKEPPLEDKEVKMGKEIKQILLKGENYIVFIFTFISTLAPVIIMYVYMFVVQYSLGIITHFEPKSIMSESALGFLGATVVFSLLSGVGTVMGSLLIGKLSDKNRSKALNISYLGCIAFYLLSNIMIGPVLGFIGPIILGLTADALVVSSQTIRGSITQNKFKDSKSTYYALLISFANLGGGIGVIIGVSFLNLLYGIFGNNVPAIYFWITIICSSILLLSWLFFKLINPKDYEIDSKKSQEKDILFG